MTRLWEANHPYYCDEGNFYQAGEHLEYGSWDEFHDEWGGPAEDYNAVFRWDWNTPDPIDYEDGEEMPPSSLVVHWVLQRKAILRSTECPVSEADEPAVREWLRGHAAATVARWEPLLGTGSQRQKR